MKPCKEIKTEEKLEERRYNVSVVDIFEICLVIISWIITIHHIHNKHDNTASSNILGDLFISDDGSMYSQFDVPAPEIEKMKTITLKIHKV